MSVFDFLHKKKASEVNNLPEVENVQTNPVQQQAPISNPPITLVNKPSPSPVQTQLLDFMTHLTQRSRAIVMQAQKQAKLLENEYVDLNHILHGLLTDNEITAFLNKLAISPLSVENELKTLYKKENNTTSPQISTSVMRLFSSSLKNAKEQGLDFVAPEHILSTLISEPNTPTSQLLINLGLTKENVQLKNTKDSPITQAESVKIDRDDLAKNQTPSQLDVSTVQKLENDAHEKLENQKSALLSTATALRRNLVGINPPNHPLGCFVLYGPLGVGKTHYTKMLSEILFDRTDRIIEYQVQHTSSALDDKFLHAIKNNPHNIIVFSDIEKANKDFLGILHEVVSNGRVEDRQGNAILFNQTFVICTSNSFLDNNINDTPHNQANSETSKKISTYAVSAKGREIITSNAQLFIRDSKQNTWTTQSISDYFLGQKIDSGDEREDHLEFPIDNFDTHTFTRSGVEMISKKDHLFYRTAPQTKTWHIATLREYFDSCSVVNANSQNLEEQLPYSGISTHAFSFENNEIVTFKDRFWRRTTNSKEWETKKLADYFKDKANNSTTLPYTQWDSHMFLHDGSEVIVAEENVWLRMANSTIWEMQDTAKHFDFDDPVKTNLDTQSNTSNNLIDFFGPELYYAFDEIVEFKPFSDKDKLSVVHDHLDLLKELLASRGIELVLTTSVAQHIVSVGFDLHCGAHPLKHTLQQLIENPLSQYIFDKKVEQNDVIAVEFDGKKFSFSAGQKDKSKVTSTSENTINHFECSVCNNIFETSIMQNSTTICSKCSSTNIHSSITAAITSPPEQHLVKSYDFSPILSRIEKQTHVEPNHDGVYSNGVVLKYA